MSRLVPGFLLFLCLVQLGFSATPSDRSLVEGVGFEQKLGSYLPPETRLMDEKGEVFPLKQYLGELPTILVFAYYQCPNLCTLVLNGLVQALSKMPDRLGKDFSLITLSIRPGDKPALALGKKRTYLARLGESDDSIPWHFLTGNESSIREVANDAGFHYRLDPVSKEYSHPSGLIVVTPSGKISQYFFGVQFDPNELSRALKEAAQEKPGRWIQEVLLTCFHYDPSRGQNSGIILSLIRWAGAVGALGVAGFLLWLFYSRKESSS